MGHGITSRGVQERRPYYDKGSFRRPIDGQKRWTFLGAAFAST